MFPHTDPTADRTQPCRVLNWQVRRGYANARRLEQDVAMLAVANGATCLGRDAHVADLFERAGMGDDAIAVVRFKASGRTSTVAVPTFRTWNRDTRRRLASEVAEAAFHGGRVVLVASPHDVTRQPRLANAGVICRSMLPPAAGDAEIVGSCIRRGGGEASLEACGEALGPPLARERIFGLMAGGCLEIDLDVALGAESRVRLRRCGWSFGWDMFGWPTACRR